MASIKESLHGTWALGSNNPYEAEDICRVRKRILPRDSIWTWVITASLLCVVFVFSMLTLSLYGSIDSFRAKASSIKDNATTFLSAAKEGDQNKLQRSATSVSEAAHGIQDELETPIWEFVSRLPVIGSDVDSIRTLSNVLIDFSDSALIPMSKSGNILALANFVHDGSIDASVLPKLLLAVEEATPAINRATSAVGTMDDGHVGPVKEIIGTSKEAITTVGSITKRMRPLFPYLSGLLGADGKTKHYLVLAENTAEIHASGGFVGSFAIMSITNGKIEIGDFNNLADVLSFAEYPAGATQDEIDSFGERCDLNHGDHNVIPDFSRVGQLYHNIWGFYQDTEVDGVFGLDPVFLQYMLEAVGSIKTSFGVTVDGSNAAAVMLNQSLFWWDPGKCDDFYREVANKAMDKIFDNLDELDLSAFLSAISKAADEGRCLVWVRDEIIEQALKEADFAGELAHDPTAPEVGVYVSDGSVSKLSFYLGMDTKLDEPTTNADGSLSYPMKILLKNNFDPTIHKSVPGYIEVQTPGRSKLDLAEWFSIVAPEGGRIEDLRVESHNPPEGGALYSEWKNTTYQGLDVWGATLRINAQESIEIDCTVVTSPEASDPLVVRKTPLMPPNIAYWNQDLKVGQ